MLNFGMVGNTIHAGRCTHYGGVKAMRVIRKEGVRDTVSVCVCVYVSPVVITYL